MAPSLSPATQRRWRADEAARASSFAVVASKGRFVIKPCRFAHYPIECLSNQERSCRILCDRSPIRGHHPPSQARSGDARSDAARSCVGRMRRSRREAPAPVTTQSGGHSGAGGNRGRLPSRAGGAGTGGDRTTGTAGMSNVGSSSTSTEVSSTTSVSTSFTTGLFPCVDGGQGGMNGSDRAPPGWTSLLSPLVQRRRVRVSPEGAICVNDLCCVAGILEGGAIWPGMHVRRRVPREQPVLFSKARAMGAASDCDCPAGKSCQQATFQNASRSPAASAQQV